MKTISHREKRTRRHRRIRSRVIGTAVRPRLSVFRSNRYVWAQLIDDETGHTLAAVGTRNLAARPAVRKIGSKSKTKQTQSGQTTGDIGGRAAAAAAAGEKLAGMAVEKKISAAVFDRGGYRYHGLIRAVAEGARKGGLTF